ncbi:Protein TIC 22-like [Arachis hypogaea]|nr:Protein TIC 22-like [Arachis hypogaea]
MFISSLTKKKMKLYSTHLLYVLICLWQRRRRTEFLHNFPVDFLFFHDLPVYALSNPSEEFLLVVGASTNKNLGLFCFNKDDAQALRGVSIVDPRMCDGSKVVPVTLNKVL